VDTYLQVVTSQTTALANERNDIDIMRRQFEANVLLNKALGGGWDTSGIEVTRVEPGASQTNFAGSRPER
jgi:outer membrane protein TolC